MKVLIFMCVAKSPEATLSFVMSTFILSVRVEQTGSHLTDFHEVWYLYIFKYSVKKIKIKLKSDRNNWYFHEDLFRFMKLFRRIPHRMRNVSAKSYGEFKTHVLCLITPLRKSCYL